ncbi:alpha/beta hydrolase family protein [Flavobacterium muglaense]|uniref:Alpha/beta hydrolase n=1 Tax=Flavobacterium muglaense TaxID=2764716 RepID=A0A923MZN5_9FLAO|nr:alpha/beta hydrolase [Flavobacterium muglaense]MBC5836681.1 alpha/beta hydrolase [Flavobacterium muglaense]MBC5843053.1 alpha/beta hydrolase [Flavobacterium muglaense]
MILNKTFILEGASKQKFVADLSYSETQEQKGVIVFCHGFKGFKDWGCWQLVADYFVDNGFAFLKFNFSHNGMGLEDSVEFTALDQFSINTLGKEMQDIESVEQFIVGVLPTKLPAIHTESIYIIGHSKGGVSALLYCTQYDTKIKKVCTWASPFDFHRSWNSNFKNKWIAENVQYIKNARTNQMMPLDIVVLDDLENNKEKYSLVNASQKLQIPYLIVQGTNDQAVKMDEFNLLKKYFFKAKNHVIVDANHVFGGSHPYAATELPEHTQELVRVTKDFLI